MQKMLGDIVALESVKDKEIEHWNKEKNMNNSCVRSRKIGMREQRRKKKSKLNKIDSMEEEQTDGKRKATSESIESKRIKVRLVNIKRPVLVDFVLRKHPKEQTIPCLERQYIRSSELLSIGHIKRFLGKKLLYEDWPNIEVSLYISLSFAVTYFIISWLYMNSLDSNSDRWIRAHIG